MKEKEQGRDTYLRRGVQKERGRAIQGSYEGNGGKQNKKKKERERGCEECVYVFIECVCGIMCALCNTVPSDKAWGGVCWVDLATVRPISSSVV